MAEASFLSESSLGAFLKHTSAERVYGAVADEQGCFYERLDGAVAESAKLAMATPVDSAKSFMFPAKERVAVYPSGQGDSDPLAPARRSQALVGVRDCDIRALEIIDKVFITELCSDPFYQLRRENTVMIAQDCVEPCERCFCTMVGGKPYSESGFDVNLSPVDGGYVVVAGSEKGGKMLAAGAGCLAAASGEQLAQRDKQREAAVEQLEAQNKEYKPKVAFEKADKDAALARVVGRAGGCVECGACNFICPTCHCFLLYDQEAGEAAGSNERQKSWDSCLMADYAKMAGVGGMKPTPRPELLNRFNNRIRHKFEWMPDNLDVIGCVGCGRCEATCPAGLVVREVFKECTA